MEGIGLNSNKTGLKGEIILELSFLLWISIGFQYHVAMKLLALFFIAYLWIHPCLAQVPIHSSVPEELRQKINEGVELVREMEWSQESTSHRKFFGPSRGGEIYIQFLSPVAGVFYAPEDDRGLFAFAVPGYNIVHLTPISNGADVPRLELIYALLHEVHHFGELLISNRHVACPANDPLGNPIVSTSSGRSYEGLFACEDYDDGPFSLGVMMMGQILNHCQNCSEQTLRDARDLGKKLLSRITDPNIFFGFKEEYNF